MRAPESLTPPSASALPIAQEIETLIRARYPLLYVVTPEETRVRDLLQAIGTRWNKRTYEWSCSTGLVPAGASIQSQKARHAATRDPLAALEQVIEQVEPALYLFNDFHPFLTRSNHTVIRRLKEIALHLKHSYKTIVLVSPTLEIPLELEKELTVLNCRLPRCEA